MDLPLIIGIGSLIGVTAAAISAYPLLKIVPLTYGVSRIRARRSGLITNEEFRTLSTEGVHEVLYSLTKKSYPQLSEYANEEKREDLIECVLESHYLDTGKDVIKFVPKRYKDFFAAVLKRADLDFLLALVRSKVNEGYYSEFSADHPTFALNLKGDEKKKLATMDIDALLQYIKHSPLDDLFHDTYGYIKEKQMDTAEFTLFNKYFSELRILSKDEPVLRTYISREIDYYNISKAAGFHKSPRFIQKGGFLSKESLHSLKNVKDTKALHSILHKTAYKELGATDEGEHIVKQINKMRKEYALSLVKKDALGIGQMVSYLVAKQIEILNIRILLQFIGQGFDPEDIKRALVL